MSCLPLIAPLIGLISLLRSLVSKLRLRLGLGLRLKLLVLLRLLGLERGLKHWVLDRVELAIDFIVEIVWPPTDQQPEKDEAGEIEGRSNEEPAGLLSDLLLLLRAHGLVHILILGVLILSLFGLLSKIVGKVSKGSGAIVIPPFILIGEYFVGFVDFLELGFMALVVIGVVLLSKLIIGPLELSISSILGDPESEVVVL